MLDAGFLANNIQGNIQTFIGNGDWQIWNKPRGYTMCQMLCIGSGSGGGGAGNGSVSSGGGGGSGGQARLIINLMFLPDILYINPGVGGIGGNAGSGGNGRSSYVSNQPNSTAANCYLASGHTASTGGAGAGTTTAGAAEVVATAADCILSALGSVNFVAGMIGAAGSATTGTSKIAFATPFILVTGGASGGKGNTAGGNITGAGLIPTINGGSGATSGTSAKGESGIILQGPLTGLMMCGGAGGGGNSGAAGTCGDGGKGGLGSGGGSSGSGSNAGTTGALGGAGGNGLIMIQCF